MRDRLRPDYAENADAPIIVCAAVATHFATNSRPERLLARLTMAVTITARGFEVDAGVVAAA